MTRIASFPRAMIRQPLTQAEAHVIVTNPQMGWSRADMDEAKDRLRWANHSAANPHRPRPLPDCPCEQHRGRIGADAVPGISLGLQRIVLIAAAIEVSALAAWWLL